MLHTKILQSRRTRRIVSPSPVYLRKVPIYCLKTLSIQIGPQGECPYLRAIGVVVPEEPG